MGRMHNATAASEPLLGSDVKRATPVILEPTAALVDPRCRYQGIITTPIMANRIGEPILAKVGVVANDDL